MEIDIKTMSISSLQRLREDVDNELTKRRRNECHQKLDQLANLIKEIQKNDNLDIIFFTGHADEMHVSHIAEVYEKNFGLSRIMVAGDAGLD